jgi:hypothetical protein
MRTRTGWLAVLFTAGLALAPTTARGQVMTGPEVPALTDPVVPLPLYHDRPERGGFYFAGEFIFFRETNPLKHQLIAVRGFNDTDGQIQQATNFLRFQQVQQQNMQNAQVGLPAVAFTPNTVITGLFFGSGQPALDAQQVAGPGTYTPGFSFILGWRFSEGSFIEAIEFRWRHLVEAKYSAVASLLPPFNGTDNPNIGGGLENTFLFSPVFNFPAEFAGPVNKIAVVNPISVGGSANITSTPVTGAGTVLTAATLNGNAATTLAVPVSVSLGVSNNGVITTPQAAFGIWNGASVMSIDFVQRYDDYELMSRIPIYQGEYCRCYGLFGPRTVALWERFHWRTVDVTTELPTAQATITIGSATFGQGTQIVSQGSGGNTAVTAQPFSAQLNNVSLTAGAPPQAAPGNSAPDDTANYSNVVSNRLYGPVAGIGGEWYLGHGLALSTDLRAGLMIDFVREIQKYELGDRLVSNKRARRDYTLVPELDGRVNLTWYPCEGVELRVGYELMMFFNTVAAPRPVSFNFGALDAPWEKGIFRALDGLNGGIAFIF